MKAVEDLLVIDISRVLAGPYCAQLLAERGARVIKVESPEGDENRLWGLAAENGISSNFNSVNSGKQSISLNLKSAAGKEILYGLIRQCDVVIHSFLPNTAKRLGVDYDVIKEINPEAIYCSISGYGEKGPLSNKPGYDLMVQAFSGIMSMTGNEGDGPIRSGVSFIDMSTGIIAYAGILTALLKRNKDSGGAWVRASLLESVMSLMGYLVLGYLHNGEIPRQEGSGVGHLAPYQAFRCKDGYLLLGATNNAAWQRLCKALEAPDLLEDARFADNSLRVENRGELIIKLEQKLAARTVAEWCTIFEEAGVAVTPLNDIASLVAAPQVLENEMIVPAEYADGKSIQVLGSPFKVDTVPRRPLRAAPQLGSDTEAVLSEMLGLAADKISELRKTGAI